VRGLSPSGRCGASVFAGRIANRPVKSVVKAGKASCPIDRGHSCQLRLLDERACSFRLTRSTPPLAWLEFMQMISMLGTAQQFGRQRRFEVQIPIIFVLHFVLARSDARQNKPLWGNFL
jgi:hypothetical protein